MKPASQRKIVVKVGTNVLTRPDGLPDITTISHLVDQLALAKKEGYQVILVSSGAVGAGKSLLNKMGEANKVIRQQVFASIGQIRLMGVYADLLSNYNLLCAQVLATKEDFRDRIHYINMRNCFEALLKDNILPIVNENDVVAVNELMFTDNDELAGLIASMINASTLIILSNVAGVFDGPPEKEGSQLIESIEAKDKQLLKSIAPSRSSMGRGGMHTKFRIAQKSASLGIKTVIANGKQDHMITNILRGKYTGSTFQASSKVSSLKKWIAFNDTAHKSIVFLNAGAVEALCSPDRINSLLPVGITRIDGEFEKGDIVQINNDQHQVIGMGIAQYNSTLASQYLGKKGKKALVHYDYLYIRRYEE